MTATPCTLLRYVASIVGSARSAAVTPMGISTRRKAGTRKPLSRWIANSAYGPSAMAKKRATSGCSRNIAPSATPESRAQLIRRLRTAISHIHRNAAESISTANLPM